MIRKRIRFDLEQVSLCLEIILFLSHFKWIWKKQMIIKLQFYFALSHRRYYRLCERAFLIAWFSALRLQNIDRKIGGRIQNSIYMPNVRLRGIAHFINHAVREHKNERRRKAGKSSAFYSLIHRIFLRQHRTIKAAALYGNFVLWLRCDFMVIHQVLPWNHALSVRKIYS